MTFGMAGALTRTALHFYPSAGNVSAPYAVLCQLTFFAAGEEPKHLTVDGLRLSVPEGIWIDEAFAFLKDGTHAIFGLELLLICNQRRLDLRESSCIVEFASISQSTKFRPVHMREGECRAVPKKLVDADENVSVRAVSGLAIRDAFHSSTLVAVNNGLAHERFKLLAGSSCNLALESSALKIELEVPAWSAVEFDFETIAEAFFNDVMPCECSWGLFRGRTIEVEVSPGSTVSWYMVYRDVLTRKPVSVCAL